MPIKRTELKESGIPGIKTDGLGRYVVCVRWTDPKTGRRRKREKVAKSLEDAVLFKERLNGSEVPTPRTRMRFADYAEQWVKQHGSSLASSTRERYIAEIARVMVVLGDHYVDMIEEDDVAAWRDAFARDVAPTTVNAHHRTLRVALDPLVKKGILRRNPARDLSTLPEGRTRGRRGTSLNAEQFAEVLDATRALVGAAFPQDIGRMLLTVAWTGMRRGELLALKWEDVREGELHVCRALCKVKRVEKSTKTDDPRLVPIPAPLREILDEQRKWLIETQHPGLESGLVFPADPAHAAAGRKRRGLSALSWYRSGSVLDRPLRAVVKRARVPEISLHSFRRTFEDLLRRAGVQDLVRRSMAGWRTSKAQAIYSGVDAEERAEATRLLVGLVRPKGSA